MTSTPSTDFTTDIQKVLNVGTDDCNETDSNAKCIAQSSDKEMISSSAQTPTCCACDTKQTDHPVVIQMADSTLPSEHTGDSERNAEDHRCNEDAADICSNEDYEVAGQVYEHFSVGGGYERMDSIYESSLPQDGYERLGSVYERGHFQVEATEQKGVFMSMQ